MKKVFSGLAAAAQDISNVAVVIIATAKVATTAPMLLVTSARMKRSRRGNRRSRGEAHHASAAMGTIELTSVARPPKRAVSWATTQRTRQPMTRVRTGHCHVVFTDRHSPKEQIINQRITITLNPPPVRDETEPTRCSSHAKLCGWGMVAIVDAICVRALPLPPCQKPAAGSDCKTAPAAKISANRRNVNVENPASNRL